MNRITASALKIALGVSMFFVLFSAPAAAASKVPVNLRVVTYSGKILFDGKARAGTTSVKPNSNCLGGSAGPARRVTGPTALSAIKDASLRARSLRPFTLSDGTFGFGICGFGQNVVKGENWWVFKYQHKSSMTGVETTKVRKNSSILMYLAKSYNEPTPVELSLVAPVKVKKGATTRVRVFSYDDAGKRKPVQGAKLSVGGALTDARGFTRVTVRKRTGIVARLAGTIPSNRAVISLKK